MARLGRVAMLVVLWGCATDEDNVRAKIDEAGLTDVVLTPPGEGSDMWTFTGKKGDQACTGDARIDLDGGIRVRERCRTPPGPLEAELPSDAPAGLVAAAKGCDEGEAKHCIALGEYYVNGAAIAANPAKGLGLLDARCVAGAAAACTSAGAYRYDGTKVEKDLARALADFDAACKAGDAPGCERVAQMQLAGEGTAKDPKAAMDTYDRGCLELNDVGICARAGLIHDQGAGVPASEARAYKLWKHGCDQGSQQCCGYTGLYTYQGSGVAANKAQGKAMLKGACDAGDAWSCDMLKQIR